MSSSDVCWTPLEAILGLAVSEMEGEGFDLARQAAQSYFSGLTDLCQGRQLVHFGNSVADFAQHVCTDRSSGKHKPVLPFPGWITNIADHLFNARFVTCRLTQASLILYPPGVGIMPHLDGATCFGPEIVMISLQGTVTMEFHHGQDKRARKFTRPGTFFLLENQARYSWLHAIPNQGRDYDDATKTWVTRTGPRISLILRSYRPGSGYNGLKFSYCRMCRFTYGDLHPCARIGFCDACKPDVKPRRYLRNPEPGIPYERPFLVYWRRRPEKYLS